MGPICEQTGASGLERLLDLQVENRAWSKDLRRRSQALVDSRLAKKISMEEYVANRTQNVEDTNECRRRGAALVQEISQFSAVMSNNDPSR
jgi:hypothetical protein